MIVYMAYQKCDDELIPFCCGDTREEVKDFLARTVPDSDERRDKYIIKKITL